MEITINSTLELLTEINKLNKLLSEDITLKITNIDPDTQLNLTGFRAYSITIKGSVSFDTLTIDNCQSRIFLENIESDVLNVKSSYVKLTSTTINELNAEDGTVDIHNSNVNTINNINSSIIKPTAQVRKQDSNQSGLTVQTITDYEVTAKQQRAMNKINAPYSEGVYQEYEQECNIRPGDTEVTVEGGLISCGGLILETAVTGVSIPIGDIPSNTKCIIVAEGNLSNDAGGTNNSLIKVIKGTTTTYPTLTKNNLTTGSSGVFQTELGRFSKPATGSPVIDYSSKITLNKNITDIMEDLDNKVTSELALKQDITDPAIFKGDGGLTIQKKNGSSKVTLGSFDTGFQIKNHTGTFLNVNDSYSVYTNKGNLLYADEAKNAYVKKSGDIVADGADFKNSKNAGLFLNNDESKVMAGDGLSAIAVATKGVNISSDNKVEYYAKQGHSFSGSDVSINGSLTASTDLKGNLVYAPYGFKTLSDSSNIGYMQVKTADGNNVRLTLADQNQEGKRAQTMTQYEGSIRVTDFLLREDQFSVYLGGEWHRIVSATKDISIYGEILKELNTIQKTRNINEPIELLKESLKSLDTKTRKIAEDSAVENERNANAFQKQIENN